MSAAPVSCPVNVAEQLRDDEIHVWYLPYRRALGRDPLRCLLAVYLGIDVEQLALVASDYGRPALAVAHDQTLGFNWSHCGTRAAIAVARDIAPGIDVEQRRRSPRALEIAERFFSADETAVLVALSPHERVAAFLEIWTAKEAVLKALGRGLSFGLDRLSIARGADGLRLQRLQGEDTRAWQLLALDNEASLVGAVAWRGGRRYLRQFTLAPEC